MVEGLEKTSSKIVTSKVIVATGMTSEPFIPKIEGSEKFGKPLFHSRDFKEHQDLLETKGKVVVMGGNQSAWDAAYTLAEKGVEVEWVIRESGHGPCWMSNPYVTPFKKRLERLMQTRLLTFFSPCVWGDADGYTWIRNFLHATWLGRFIVDIYWKLLGNHIKSLNQYSKHSETAKLEPWSDSFWVASSLSTLSYPTNIFDYIRSGKIKVYIADISSLSPKKVKLNNGTEIEAEALICCTGWKHKPPLTFLPKGLESVLGLTSVPLNELPSILEPATKMLQMADTEILTRFPRLAKQPAPNPKLKAMDKSEPPPLETEFFPQLLTRFMVPPTMNNANDHTIAFAGRTMTASTTIIAQVQALWISSYLDSGFPASRTKTTNTTFAHGMTDRLYETLLHNRFGKWRYPNGWGARVPDFVFDALPYIDLLLGDLGLERYRKGGGVREVFEAYTPKDYEGLIGEWMEKKREREEVLERVEWEERERRVGKKGGGKKTI